MILSPNDRLQTDDILAEINPVIVTKLLEAVESLSQVSHLHPAYPSPLFNVVVDFSFQSHPPQARHVPSPDHLIGLGRQERARRGSRQFAAAVPRTCLDL